MTEREGSKAIAGFVRGLSLAAAPTFAVMALLTGALDVGRANPLCSALQQASPLDGMGPMYLLMSVFHAAPWLSLIARRWTSGHRI